MYKCYKKNFVLGFGRFSNLLDLYGPLHVIWLSFCVVFTWLFFRKARLVRLPIMIRGRKNITFGRGFTCGYFTRLDAFGSRNCLTFGNNVQLNDFVHIGALNKVEIGDDVLIASRVFISDHNHGRFDGNSELDAPYTRPAKRPLHAAAVKIGSNVWIGESVCILAGVTIGNGAVIGAGSIVTKNIPPHSVAVGNPARVIRVFDVQSQRWCAV